MRQSHPQRHVLAVLGRKTGSRNGFILQFMRESAAQSSLISEWKQRCTSECLRSVHVHFYSGPILTRTIGTTALSEHASPISPIEVPHIAALLSGQIYFSVVLLALCFTCPAATRASELTKPTAEAFQRYVQRTETRMQSELADPEHFLYFDSLPEQRKNAMLTRLHNGQVVIEQMQTDDNGKEIKVPGGLVHHWLAIGFIPGITRDQVIDLAQDYPRHVKVYAPDVEQAQVLEHFDQHFLVSYRFYRHAIVTTVYNTEFNVDYQLPDSSRGYCFARAARIAEVQNPGKPDEKELSVGNDHGYMWRLNLYTRYLEKDNGVYVQIEFVALSQAQLFLLV